MSLRYAASILSMVLLAAPVYAQGDHPPLPLTYEVRRIPPLGAGFSMLGAALNATGDIVGTASLGGMTRAFVIMAGVTIDLGVIFPSRSTAAGINNAGTIVGTWFTPFGQRRGFVIRNGVPSDLGPDVIPIDVNTAEQIAAEGGLILNLDGTQITFAARPRDLNNRGDVAGDGGNSLCPYLRRDGIQVDFVALGLPACGNPFSGVSGWVSAVNDNGVAVGQFRPPSSGEHQTFRLTGNSLSPLPAFQTEALNNHGYVVGSAQLSGVQRAGIMDGTTVIDLNDRLPAGEQQNLFVAVDINDAGQILAHARRDDGSLELVLLSPSPISDPSCGTDISGQLSFQEVQFPIPMTPLILQIVVLTNTSSAPIPTPSLNYVMTDLGDAYYLGRQNSTFCFSPQGQPYITISTGPDGVMAPGEQIPAVLWFASRQPLSYTVYLLSGVLAGFSR